MSPAAMRNILDLFLASFTPGKESKDQQETPNFAQMNADTIKGFIAGALLPTLAWYLLLYQQRSSPSKHDNDSDDDASKNEPALDQKHDTAKQWGLRHAPYKMMLVVNQELSMGKGKIAAQCGHAAVGCYHQAQKHCPSGLRAWNQTGCAKIAVKCPNTEELETIASIAMSKGIPCYLVEDAGRTQIAAGSRTVLGLFGPTTVFEGVTDHLKLM